MPRRRKDTKIIFSVSPDIQARVAEKYPNGFYSEVEKQKIQRALPLRDNGKWDEAFGEINRWAEEYLSAEEAWENRQTWTAVKRQADEAARTMKAALDNLDVLGHACREAGIADNSSAADFNFVWSFLAARKKRYEKLAKAKKTKPRTTAPRELFVRALLFRVWRPFTGLPLKGQLGWRGHRKRDSPKKFILACFNPIKNKGEDIADVIKAILASPR